MACGTRSRLASKVFHIIIRHQGKHGSSSTGHNLQCNQKKCHITQFQSSNISSVRSFIGGKDKSGQKMIITNHHSTKISREIPATHYATTWHPNMVTLIHDGTLYTRYNSHFNPLSARQMIHEQMSRSITGLLRFSTLSKKIKRKVYTYKFVVANVFKTFDDSLLSIAIHGVYVRSRS